MQSRAADAARVVLDGVEGQRASRPRRGYRMRSAGVGIMFLIERVNQRLMTHPTNKTPAMIRNVVGHQPEQAGGPVPAPRVPSLPNQLAINKRAEGSMKQSARENGDQCGTTARRSHRPVSSAKIQI